MDFDTYLGAAWSRHGDEPEAVAAELAPVGLPLAASPAQVVRLSHLAHHLHGEHLARWAEGVAFQQRLAALPALLGDDARDAAASVRCHVASLRLSSGDTDAGATLPASERVRAQALAASNLVGRDSPRAAALFAQALAEAQALPEDGPHTRALAITGNALACTLEDKPGRSADERTLMLLAAETARRCWAIAGSWLQVERADYRLAMSWLQAGEPVTARGHAQACLDRVRANGSVPLELFFAFEALARAAHAAGDTVARDQAVARAQAAFDLLDAVDSGWVHPSLRALQTLQTLQTLPRG